MTCCANSWLFQRPLKCPYKCIAPYKSSHLENSRIRSSTVPCLTSPRTYSFFAFLILWASLFLRSSIKRFLTISISDSLCSLGKDSILSRTLLKVMPFIFSHPLLTVCGKIIQPASATYIKNNYYFLKVLLPHQGLQSPFEGICGTLSRQPLRRCRCRGVEMGNKKVHLWRLPLLAAYGAVLSLPQRRRL